MEGLDSHGHIINDVVPKHLNLYNILFKIFHNWLNISLLYMYLLINKKITK